MSVSNDSHGLVQIQGTGKPAVPEFWRSLEERVGDAGLARFVANEFPSQLPEVLDPVSRRHWMKLMGASLALAGLNACTKQPPEKVVPYVRAPEEFVPGKPSMYATAMPHGGYGMALLAESHMGRPTKVEGNPEHPASLGATDVFAQASVLGLYDPDRSQAVNYRQRISSYTAFLSALSKEREAQLLKKGAGLRILSETVTSPTLSAQLRELLAEMPAARWVQYEPASREMARAGSMLAFSEYVETLYRFDQANVVLSLDADFMHVGPGALRYARDFMGRRSLSGDPKTAEMNRLYVVESSPTLAGAMADHRMALRNSEIEAFTRALAAKLGVAGVSASGGRWKPEWLDAVAADLQANKGAGIVVAGEYQSAVVHALAHAINQILDNTGKTVMHVAPVEANPGSQLTALKELCDEMRAGKVDTLLILGGNPVYDAPADFEFLEGLKKVKVSVRLSLYSDETSEHCTWQVPEAHYLESWGDVRAFDGTVTVMQPLIAPLYSGKSALEMVATLRGQGDATGFNLVRDYWAAQFAAGRVEKVPGRTFEQFWRRVLHDGLVPGTASPPKPVVVKALNLPPAPASEGLEVAFRPDAGVWDGRFANLSWMQELPRPLTKLTWDNAAHLSPATARRLSVAQGDVVELTLNGRTLRAPVLIQPGQAEDCTTIHLGFGRTRAGRVGTGPGFNAYPLRTSQTFWFAGGASAQKTGDRHQLVTTQLHHSMEGRHMVRVATLEHFHEHPDFARHLTHVPDRDLTLYPDYEYKSYKWGLVIDTQSCIGCNACLVACQAENNIPVVGKDQVANGREMHWIRIDRYYSGPEENPDTYFQPLPCMHCENAPCETVCPVAATVHSEEGLNQMVYNRCVGTRYCSNNCPYKVRRFNFFLYSDWDTQSLYGLRNPDVTVRSRGVMEKCTYCIQRINSARIEAEKEGRRIGAQEVVTACQQVCPTQAITFGDLNNKDSKISRLVADPRNYGLLEDLNTRPRTTYLARVRNPNPALEKA